MADTPLQPEKSEAFAVLILKRELASHEAAYLREVDLGDRAMDFPQLPKIRELNQAIGYLEARPTSVQVPRELWESTTALIKEYANENNWRDEGIGFDNVLFGWCNDSSACDTTITMHGYEPAQSLLKKLTNVGEKKDGQ